MHHQNESRSFLQKLLQNPPPLPFEPMLLPLLFAATREDSTASVADLVSLVERSQKLTSHVLTIANSAAYGLQFKVSTLHRAVAILGIREIRLLTVMVGMASTIRDAKLPGKFDSAGLWQHQLRVAVIAKTLVMQLGGENGVCGPGAEEDDRLEILPDEAYVVGLLHDIGKIFFASSRPDLWNAVEAMRIQNGTEYAEAEIAYWGMDHGLIGAEVLHHWKLPLLLIEPINWHHAPELAPAHIMETRLLAAANHIAREGLGTENALPERALALLPAGCDPAALGAALAQNLSAVKTKTFVSLIK